MSKISLSMLISLLYMVVKDCSPWLEPLQVQQKENAMSWLLLCLPIARQCLTELDSMHCFVHCTHSIARVDAYP